KRLLLISAKPKQIHTRIKVAKINMRFCGSRQEDGASEIGKSIVYVLSGGDDNMDDPVGDRIRKYGYPAQVHLPSIARVQVQIFHHQLINQLRECFISRIHVFECENIRNTVTFK